jgi:hypothetical protein
MLASVGDTVAAPVRTGEMILSPIPELTVARERARPHFSIQDERRALAPEDNRSSRMSDNDAKKTPAETPEAAAEARHAAKVGVEDRGHIVGTAADQPVDGMIADLADGDVHKHKHHPKK